MGTRELNSHSRPQDVPCAVRQQIGSGPWAINSPVGLYSALNMEEEDCSWGSPGPQAPQGWPISHTQHCAGCGMLWALGTFPMGSWLIAPSKAHSRQGQPPNRCFLIYLYSPGSPVLINYHLHSTLKREACLGEGGGNTCRNSIKIFRWHSLLLAATLLPRLNEQTASSLVQSYILNLAFLVSWRLAEGWPTGA